MAKFITIPTTVSGCPTILFNVDQILSTQFLTTTTFAVNSGNLVYTFTTSAAGATPAVAAINTAIVNPSGPIVNAAVFPAGVTIAALPVVA